MKIIYNGYLVFAKGALFKITRIAVILVLIIFNFLSAEKVPVEISADKLEHLKKENLTIFKGNASVLQGKTKIKADVIKVKGKENKYIKCFNNVKIIDSERNIVLTGKFAEYYSLEEYAKISQSPVLELKNDLITVKSEIMERFIPEKKSVATGNVVIIKENFQAISERAIYFEELDKLQLEGKPVLKTETDEYRSEKIVFLLKEDKVILIGNVSGKIETK